MWVGPFDVTMPARGRPPLWHSSFYWRIALSFVALVVLVLVSQSVMLSYLLSRRDGPFAPDNPNASATAVAARVGAALAADPAALVAPLLPPAESRQRAYVVLRDGAIVSNSLEPLDDALRLQVEAALTGVVPRVSEGAGSTGPVVTAPVQVEGQLRGMVVFPAPPRRGVLGQVADLLSLPGTLVLLLAGAAAGVFIFAPARRRLHALERAAERLGAGDLSARAPVDGKDEIAHLASAFNTMAAELAARTSALETANRLRRQMLADVSHELRTPLTAMVGYLETLAMPGVTLDTGRRARYIETLTRETGRMAAMVEDLLDLAKHEQGASSFSPRVCAVERIFDHVRARFERQAAAAGVSLAARVAPDADQLFADPGRIEQVVSNLVANALRHTPAGGQVTLSARMAAGLYQIAVADTGEGMAPAHAAHVFERFYKGDAARTGGAGSGSGLGLTIVKAIVERHGGTIAVESRPGHTEFTATLPYGLGGDGPAQSSASANL